MRSVSSRRKLLLLQKRIFRALKSEAEHLLGDPPPSIRKYEKEFENDFKEARGFKQISKADLIAQIRKSDVTLIGDFHTYDQAQRTALRIIRDSIKSGESWRLALELVPSHHQKALNSYWKGGISLQKLLDLIRYNEDWGFPIQNYRPLFEWARENQVPLVALNRPSDMFKDSGLRERDRWAAGVITDLFQRKAARPQIIALYGELHLGSRHLPREILSISKNFLGQSLQVACVHQNRDDLFWKLADRKGTDRAEILKLGKSSFCVFSGTPWAKFQSLVNWVEGEEQDLPSAETDYLSLMKSYANTFAEFLNLPSPSFESLSVLTYEDASFIDLLKSSQLFKREEIRLIRHHVLGNHRIYIPRLGIAYLGSASHNGAAELAATHLLMSTTRSTAFFERTPEDFFRLTLQSAFSYFGSLILNPKRKCDLPSDHEERLKQLAKKNAAKDLAFPEEKQARALALSCWKSQENFLRKNKHPIVDLDRALGKATEAPAIMIASRYLGQLLGKRLHSAVLGGKVIPSIVRDTCLAKPTAHPRSFEERYLSLAREGSRVPMPRSKRENL